VRFRPGDLSDSPLSLAWSLRSKRSMSSNSAQISSTSKFIAKTALVLPLLVGAQDAFAARAQAQAGEPDDDSGTAPSEVSPGFEVLGTGDPRPLYVTAMSEAGEVVVGYRSGPSGDEAVRR